MISGRARFPRLARRGTAAARPRLAARRVFLLAGHGELGGGEVMLLACADAVAASGLRPVVVAPDTPGDVAAAASELGHDVLTFRAVSSAPWWRSAYRFRRTVRRALHEADGALLWCHGLRPATATLGMGRRIVHIHRAPSRVYTLILLAVAVRARVLLVPSSSTRTVLPGSLLEKARVVGNWTAPLQRRERDVTRQNGEPVVGFLGRIAQEKGIPDLAAAFAMLTEQKIHPRPLLRVGGSPRFVSASEAEELDRVLRQMGDRVDLRGWVDRAEFLAGIDVLVCPSRVAESFGLVVAEAMAAEVPVVVTDAGALPEVVGPQHPYIAQAADPVSLAGVLRRALDELGTDAGAAVVAAARRRWEEHWSPAAGEARVRELLAELEETP